MTPSQPSTLRLFLSVSAEASSSISGRHGVGLVVPCSRFSITSPKNIELMPREVLPANDVRMLGFTELEYVPSTLLSASQTYYIVGTSDGAGHGSTG